MILSNPTISTISVVFGLGINVERSGIKVRTPISPNYTFRAGTLHPVDSHYSIVTYGCNSGMFGVIPFEAVSNCKLFLGRETADDHVPRKHLPGILVSVGVTKGSVTPDDVSKFRPECNN
ncbi:hypothetical protein RhiJN_23607 [Ceratobasidium sp. AG-Ba]|nr:hypothetical protein RhiJN_23607 [Ceratobasidium sp. AG-Ba]